MNKAIRPYTFIIFIAVSFGLAIAMMIALQKVDNATSSNQYCTSCHVHSHADNAWIQSSHHNNKSGVVVDCVQCHLPPKDGTHYWVEKTKAASRDLYSFWFKDTAEINWNQKSELDYAKHHTFKASCTHCHQNLFPLHLSKKGDDAHLYYTNNQDKLHCLNCHIDVGHGTKSTHQANTDFMQIQAPKKIFKHATAVDKFESYQEQIPGTPVAFEMLAIPAGVYSDGENKTAPVKPFFMGKIEVSWDEYRAFLSETESEGRITNTPENVDAISGATPPFGDPSQGWGMGQRPAITMTWHAANTYCKWLSFKTGKKYRLPSSLEWAYACNANAKSDFFWGENLEDYIPKGIIRKIFKKSGLSINQHVVWNENSMGKTGLPQMVKPNHFGLLHMLGNVKEFCSDTVYATDHPTKPEHILMGGSFKSTIPELTLTYHDYTRHDEWMLTDPQIPKSLWWYSDCNDVGFRVVCEWND